MKIQKDNNYDAHLCGRNTLAPNMFIPGRLYFKKLLAASYTKTIKLKVKQICEGRVRLQCVRGCWTETS